MGHRVRSALGLATALALAAGCGSTVQLQGTQTVGGGGLGPTGQTDGLGTSGNGLPAGGTDTGGGTGGSASGSGGAQQHSGGGVQGPGTTGLPNAGPIPTGAGAALSGRGFTKTTILIGVATANDYNAFAGTLGIKGVSEDGDPKTQMQAVADDINRHGGILGRKIVLVPHDYNTAQTLNDPASANQAACVDWTQDHHVFAVALAGGVVENTLLSCLAKADTPLIDPGGGLDYPLHYAPTYAKYPLFFNIGQMVGDRYDRVAIGRLAARGFFSPWDTINGKPGTGAVKVGLLGFDDYDGRLQTASQRKQLASHGIQVADTDIVRCPRALSASVSCQQNAVLKMASNHVTHLFGAGLIFVENAESQHYRPRYFFAVEPRVIAENAPPAQMSGSMGESYVPIMDVERTEYPGDPSPQTARCNKIMKAAGQGTSDGTTLWTEHIICDQFFFLQAALNGIGALSSQALRAGFERLGSSQQSCVTWGTFLSPSEHTSATALRDVAFRDDIKRFAYVSKTNYS